jgi:hypothetical protein
MAVPARRAGQLRTRQRPRLAPVPPRSRSRRAPVVTRRPRRVAFLLFSLVVVAGLVMGLASAQVLVAQGSFRLSELTQRAEQVEVDVDLLRLRAARMASPDRVAAAARKAGLRLPRRVEVLPPPGAAP